MGVVIMTDTKKIIYLVDNNTTILTVGCKLLADYCKVFPFQSAEMMLENIGKNIPDMIFMADDMTEMNGYDAIKKLKADKRTAGIPVVLTTVNDDFRKEKNRNAGAFGYIKKLFTTNTLLDFIEKLA